MRGGEGKQGCDLIFQHQREQQVDPVATLAPVAPHTSRRSSHSASISGRLAVAQAVDDCSFILLRFMQIHYRDLCTEDSAGTSPDLGFEQDRIFVSLTSFEILFS